MDEKKPSFLKDHADTIAIIGSVLGLNLAIAGILINMSISTNSRLDSTIASTNARLDTVQMMIYDMLKEGKR